MVATKNSVGAGSAIEPRRDTLAAIAQKCPHLSLDDIVSVLDAYLLVEAARSTRPKGTHEIQPRRD